MWGLASGLKVMTLLAGAPAAAHASEPWCAEAVALVERVAASQAAQARVNCLSAERVSTAAAGTRALPPLKAGTSSWLVAIPGGDVWTVRLHLEVTGEVWRLKQARRAGARLSLDDVDTMRLAWPPGEEVLGPQQGPLPTGRLLRDRQAGQLLTVKDWVPADEALPQDTVVFRLKGHGATLELPGVLLSRGRVGDWVQVQVAQRQQVMSGRLIDGQTVEGNGP